MHISNVIGLFASRINQRAEADASGIGNESGLANRSDSGD